ncbi:GNAT family N-acetyltransferase [Ruminococcus sp.]|uniref:GNAT family N-acetyltransferase n=1 Tax=Ruminococcus sp. TaxID=41978 RepID=UPI0025D2255E|nr:GNAT family N-acetyltransferase [Ruminococcus sp.]MBQ6251826.1 GNAT family N-acetyltransferase [Ruminococcus sp.]
MVLREFIETDADYIIGWTGSEREFRLWCADRYENYPVSPQDIIDNYAACSENGDFFPMTAVDESNVPVGHLILRYTDAERTVVRFGFVIVDSSRRGHGIGREMLEMAKIYAKNVLHAKRLSLGVFAENHAAKSCYKAAGFEMCGVSESFSVLGETWKCVEMELLF